MEVKAVRTFVLRPMVTEGYTWWERKGMECCANSEVIQIYGRG
jgi:hypothetical protein